MNAINLIEKALAASEQPEVKALLSDFLRANTIAKNEKFNLAKYVSKDELRPSFTGIFHENGYRIATNINILCAVKNTYPHDFEGKIITPQGQIIDDKFPNWKAVVPKDDEITRLMFTKSPPFMLQKIKEEQAIAKTDGGADVYVSITRENKTIFFEAKMFVLFLNFVKSHASLFVGMRWKGYHSSLFAKDARGNLCLLMGREHIENSNYILDF